MKRMKNCLMLILVVLISNQALAQVEESISINRTEYKDKLGNIHETPMRDLVASAQMRKFGNDKRDTLTKQCRECEVRFLCSGGCPKDRFARSSDGEAGQNYLCAGLESFFRHSMPSMKHIVKAVQAGKTPQEIMTWVAAMDAGRNPSSA